MKINFFKCYCTAFVLFQCMCIAVAQKLPQFPSELSNPLDIPISLSGTYGEMRANHYHTGWDLQTDEKEGLSVKCIADGYISRVRISSKGYGYSIYVTHPKLGITSVYAHLSQFFPPLKKWVNEQQYVLKKNELDWVLSPDQFPVSRNQQIALSGNSGSSGGPHLHFEIRNTVTEKTIDPSLLGYKIPDVTRPLIESLSFIPKGSFMPSDVIPFRFNGESYGRDTLFEVVDTFGVAVQVYDWVLDAEHACGIKQILTLWDGNIVSEWLADSMDFKEVKHVNAQCVAGVKERNPRTTYRTYKLPNSPGTGFLYIERDGWMTIKDTMTHAVTVMTSDFSGNATCVYAFVKRKPKQKNTRLNTAYFDWITGGTIAQGDWCLRTPKDALYEETPLTWTQFSGIEKSDSMLMKISIDPKSIHFKNPLRLENNSADWLQLTPEERSKFGWMEVRKDEEWMAWEEDEKAYSFHHSGTYRWVKDTHAPEIKDAQSLSQSITGLEIIENESGLKTYNAYFDTQWVKLYFDSKNNLLMVDPNWKIQWDQKSPLRIELMDKAGNASEVIVNVN